MTVRTLSLNTVYSRKITIIRIVVVKVISLKVAGVRGLDDCEFNLLSTDENIVLNPYIRFYIFPKPRFTDNIAGGRESNIFFYVFVHASISSTVY